MPKPLYLCGDSKGEAVATRVSTTFFGDTQDHHRKKSWLMKREYNYRCSLSDDRLMCKHEVAQERLCANATSCQHVQGRRT